MTKEFFLAAEHLLEALNQTRLFHWRTAKYSEHKALGDFYDFFSDWLDTFVESWQGSTGMRVEITQPFVLENDEGVRSYYTVFAQWLLLELPRAYSSSSCPDLQNMRDELLGEVRKLEYLLGLS